MKYVSTHYVLPIDTQRCRHRTASFSYRCKLTAIACCATFDWITSYDLPSVWHLSTNFVDYRTSAQLVVGRQRRFCYHLLPASYLLFWYNAAPWWHLAAHYVVSPDCDCGAAVPLQVHNLLVDVLAVAHAELSHGPHRFDCSPQPSQEVSQWRIDAFLP